MFAATLLLAACGSVDVPSPSASPSVEPSIVLPLDPVALGLTCGDGNIFHPALLGVPGAAENDPDAAAAALRLEIAGSAPGFPRSGWVRVAQLADRVQFVAPDRDGDGWLVVGFALRDGRWTLDLKGDCHPEVVLPPGVSRAEWRLDPAFPPPAAGDRLLHVLIHEQACANGRPPVGRVLPPLATPSQTAMTIAILVTNVPGGADCPGNPEFAVTVDLPEPLGGRPLFDGAVFPPRDVTQPASG